MSFHSLEWVRSAFYVPLSLTAAPTRLSTKRPSLTSSSCFTMSVCSKPRGFQRNRLSVRYVHCPFHQWRHLWSRSWWYYSPHRVSFLITIKTSKRLATQEVRRIVLGEGTWICAKDYIFDIGRYLLMRFINAIYLDIDVIPTGVATSQLRPPLCSRAINQRASVGRAKCADTE